MTLIEQATKELIKARKKTKVLLVAGAVINAEAGHIVTAHIFAMATNLTLILLTVFQVIKIKGGIMKTKEKKYDVVGAIMDFEGGEIDNEGVIELFSHLIKTGMAWSLQGSYGRTTSALIESGYISKEGVILKYE